MPAQEPPGYDPGMSGELPLRPCSLVAKAEVHDGHRHVIRKTKAELLDDEPSAWAGRRVLVWCPGLDELIVELPEMKEDAAVSIADEPAGPLAGANPVLEGRTERQGRLAYYAYGKMTDGRSVHGEALPDWKRLRPPVQHAWIEAARAVRADTLDPDWAHRTGADNPAAPWNRIESGRDSEEKAR